MSGANPRNGTLFWIRVKSMRSIKCTLSNRDTSKVMVLYRPWTWLMSLVTRHISSNMQAWVWILFEFLLDCWTNHAISKYLQMDNGAYFIGDLRHARHFSRVVRLCLCFGVEPVFISPRKPWMDGTIEDCNGECEEKLWAWEQFSDLEHLRREAKIFLTRHSNRQDWKYRNANLVSMRHRKIAVDFTIDK